MDFSVPIEEGEDIEVIEIDEGEIEQVLENEPFLTRLAYKFTTAIEDIRHKFVAPKVKEPPPKLPPQFFTPPKPTESVSVKKVEKRADLEPGKIPLSEGAEVKLKSEKTAGMSSVQEQPKIISLGSRQEITGAEGQGMVQAKAKAKITPFDKVPRRVRVIKRIRKPVRVSFVSEHELKLLRVDIPRRRFTFITLFIIGGILLGGSAYLLKNQIAEASFELAKADKQLSEVRKEIRDVQGAWTSFQGFEPKLRALVALLDKHVSPTRLFELIEQNTLPTVSYQSFSLTAEKRVSLAVSADSFDTAAKQVFVFQNAGFIKKVETSGYTALYDPPESYTPKAVEFQVILTLTDDALKNQLAGTSVE